jgi:PAS domain S-box-containing protein
MEKDRTRLLLVGGTEDATPALATHLEENGYHVTIIRDGEEAISRLSSTGKPDLIIYDLDADDVPESAPDSDAAEKEFGTAARILQLADIPLLFLSSRTEPEVVDRATSMASYGYVLRESGGITGILAAIRTALRLHGVRLSEQREREQRLSELSTTLAERVKELEALHRIARVLDGPDIGLSRTIEEILTHLCAGMRFPDRAEARISVGSMTHETAGFCEASRTLSASLRISGGVVGTVEVCYVDDDDDMGLHPAEGPETPANPFLDGEERMLQIVADQIGTFMDRNRSDRILRAGEARYRAIFEQSPDGICLADVATGRIIDCNETLAALVGRRRSDLIGRPQSILHPEDPDQNASDPHEGDPRTMDFRQHLAGTSEDVIQSQVVTSDGLLRDVEIVAHRVDYRGTEVLQGIFRDVTEVKAIRDRAAFQSRLLDHVGQAIVVTDANGIITYWNAAAERLFGWSSGEALERLITEVTTAEDAADLAAAVMERLAAGDTWTGRISMRRKDGSVFPAIVSDTPVFSPERTLVAIIGVTTDVTELTEAEERARALLAEKELILREVNHRIKNNIYTMISMLSLQASAATSQELRRGLEGAMHRMTSMLVLYESLYRSEHVSEFPVDRYVRDLVSRIAESTGLAGSTTITMDLPEETWNARALSVLGIIINELLTNAAKYAFNGQDRGRISLEITTTGERSRLMYTDDGVGIPAEIDPAQSAGLGLRFVAALAEQVDGRVAIENGSGTRIAVEFETPAAG